MSGIYSRLAWRALTGSADAITMTDVTENTGAAAENAVENIQNATDILNLPPWIGNLIYIVAVIVVTSIVLRIVARAFKTIINRSKGFGANYGMLLSFAHNVVRVLIYFFAISSIVYSIPGAAATMNMILASGGVIAVVLGFAGQDALSNVAGGVMILFFKPFQLGDLVNYLDKNIVGTVEEITLRHTVINTANNKRVIIPNGTMNQCVLENANYAEKKVCEFFEIGITYETDMKKAIAVLAEEVEKNPQYKDIRTPEEIANNVPKVKIRVIELADSAVILRAWLWAEDVGTVMNLKFELNESVKNRFDAEGLDFAYPHMQIVQE